MENDFAHFASDLHDACCNVGFFVLAGLPPQTVQLHREVLRIARAFFALPSEEKRRIEYCYSPQFRGYMQLGVENTAGRRDEREQIEFGREEPVPPMPADAQLFERLRGPNQWPDDPQEFRSIIGSWLHEMEALSWSVTRALSASMGLDAHSLDSLFKLPHIQAKLVHYPAAEETGRAGLFSQWHAMTYPHWTFPNSASLPGRPEPTRESQADPDDASAAPDVDGLGVGAHSDSGFLTLLLQDEVGGLEVLNSEGQWVAATPIPGSLVCNLGEVVQLLSGGSYLSTVHRVQRPRPGSGGRLSAPFFWNPSLDAIVSPLALPSASGRSDSSAVPSARPKEDSNRLIPSYGMNAFKSLARSHPEVFARHHPDLRVLQDGQVVLR